MSQPWRRNLFSFSQSSCYYQDRRQSWCHLGEGIFLSVKVLGSHLPFCNQRWGLHCNGRCVWWRIKSLWPFCPKNQRWRHGGDRRAFNSGHPPLHVLAQSRIRRATPAIGFGRNGQGTASIWSGKRLGRSCDRKQSWCWIAHLTVKVFQDGESIFKDPEFMGIDYTDVSVWWDARNRVY